MTHAPFPAPRPFCRGLPTPGRPRAALELAARLCAVRRALDNPILVADATSTEPRRSRHDPERAHVPLRTPRTATELGDDMYQRRRSACSAASNSTRRRAAPRRSHDSLASTCSSTIAEASRSVCALRAAAAQRRCRGRSVCGEQPTRPWRSVAEMQSRRSRRGSSRSRGTLGLTVLQPSAEGYRLGFAAVLSRTADVVAAETRSRLALPVTKGEP
jgi:hypothetical protein